MTEDDAIVNNTKYVCDIMNSFYIDIAKDIGPPNMQEGIQSEDQVSEFIDEYQNHASIKYFKDNQLDNGLLFDFEEVTEDHVFKLLLKLNNRKATGHDNIPAKLLKYGAHALSQPIQIHWQKNDVFVNVHFSLVPKSLRLYIKRRIVLIKLITDLSVFCQLCRNY